MSRRSGKITDEGGCQGWGMGEACATSRASGTVAMLEIVCVPHHGGGYMAVFVSENSQSRTTTRIHFAASKLYLNFEKLLQMC